MKQIEEELSIADYVDWCSEQNFRVNNFRIHHKYLVLSKIRYDMGLHVICTICRKILRILR